MKKNILRYLAAAFMFAMILSFAPTASAATTLDYHAYMGVQTNTQIWIFRNAYDEPTYGFGKDAFKGLSSVSGTKVTSYKGTFTDAAITKDGTYTVTLDKPDFSTETSMSQLYVSTDIPNYESIKVKDVSVKIDGKTIYTFDKAILNPESFTYVQIMCLNIWNKEVASLFTPKLPFTKCEITFTISGLDKAKAEQDKLKDFTVKLTKDAAVITGYTGSSTSVTIPSKAYGKPVTEIGANAFANTKVTKVTYPGTLTTIGKNAFYNTKLTDVTIPKGVASIGDGAFAASTGIKSFAVAKGNAKFVAKDGIIFSKDMAILVAYPAGKTATSYTVASTITKIQGGAFDGCTKLTKITIPATVKTIGTDAFKGATKLTIYTPSTSAAYTYATKQGIKVKKS